MVNKIMKGSNDFTNGRSSDNGTDNRDSVATDPSVQMGRKTLGEQAVGLVIGHTILGGIMIGGLLWLI